jgi:probable F420-dependent oxidoreductase
LGVVFTASFDASRWSECARRVEGEGFDTLLVADHYHNPLSCGPLLAAAATATTTLRIGSYVYNNDFRHPALLAKEVATLDVLSGGRMEFGIGAGWHKKEYDEASIPFDQPGVRAARFREGLEIIRHLLAGERVHYEGQHYRLNGLEGTPLPVQRPIPLLIGGGGPRMISLAAREADIVAFVPRSMPGGGLDPAEFAPQYIDTKVELLEAAAREAGRADGLPERSVLLFGLYQSLEDVADDDWIPRDLVATSPYALVGDTDTIIDTMHMRRERWGLTYYVCFDYDIEKFLPVVHKLAR